MVLDAGCLWSSHSPCVQHHCLPFWLSLAFEWTAMPSQRYDIELRNISIFSLVRLFVALLYISSVVHFVRGDSDTLKIWEPFIIVFWFISTFYYMPQNEHWGECNFHKNQQKWGIGGKKEINNLLSVRCPLYLRLISLIRKVITANPAHCMGLHEYIGEWEEVQEHFLKSQQSRACVGRCWAVQPQRLL